MSDNLRKGDDALLSCENGIDNTAIGNEALSNVEGSGNTALGEGAGKLNADGSPCLSADDSVYIGKDAAASADDVENEVVIGSEAEGQGSNSVTLGNDAITKTYLKGEVACPKLAPTLMIIPKALAAPINAVAAKAVLVVTSRPDDFVDMVKSSLLITVATQPNILTKADGTITVTGTPIADETFELGGETYTFKAVPSAAFEVGINADNTSQAVLIAAAITEDSTNCDATNEAGVVTTVAKTGGAAGNSLTLTESATGLAVSGAGTLTGGLDADTLILDEGGAGEITYTFIANGETPGETELAIGSDVAGTAAVIADATMPATLTAAFVEAADVKFTAVADGTGGDGITINSDSTRITGDGDTAGGVDEVKSYLTVNGIDYVFANSAGNDPETTYPSCHKVATAGGCEMSVIAAALKAALILDETAFTDASITVDTATLTVKYKEKGSAGNDITYVNNLVVAGDITDDTTDGTLVDAVDGTPGYKGMVTSYGNDFYMCNTDDYTTAQDGWLKTTMTTF